MTASSPYSAALFGATGLVGTECLRLLLADPACTRVVTVTRRPLPPDVAGGGSDDRLEQCVADFDRLEEQAPHLAVDRVFCALGTTMRQAGSREAFRRVDYDLTIEIARLALAGGVPHLLLVSSVGANPESRAFYTRVKGEVEAALLALPFRSITIVRPSVLVGPRDRPRTGEVLGRVLGRALGVLVPGRYRPVQAADVARVLVRAAHENRPGARIIESEEIRSLARAEPQEVKG